MLHPRLIRSGRSRWLVAGVLASLALAGCASGLTRYPPAPTPEVAAPTSGRVATGGAAAGGDPSPAADGAITGLDIKDLAFTPAAMRVPVGSVLTWTNRDLVAHTVTSDAGTFDSGVLQNRQTFTWTFDTAGTFSYLCTIHPSMVASVIVDA